MRIVCLGASVQPESAQDILDSVNARYALTSNTSQKMLDLFNKEGGNTPLQRNTTMASTTPTEKSSGGIFNMVTGIFDKLGTIASREPVQTEYKVKDAAFPLPAVLGIGAVAFILYKAVK